MRNLQLSKAVACENLAFARLCNSGARQHFIAKPALQSAGHWHSQPSDQLMHSVENDVRIFFSSKRAEPQNAILCPTLWSKQTLLNSMSKYFSFVTLYFVVDSTGDSDADLTPWQSSI